MSLRRPQPLLALLCLLGLGLTNALVAHGWVICRDGHGVTRVERSCQRNASGECVTACGPDADDPGEDHPEGEGPAHPCDDTPITDTHQVMRGTSRAPAEMPILIPAPCRMMAAGADLPRVPRGEWGRAGPMRPPDALYRLRSVILMV